MIGTWITCFTTARFFLSLNYMYTGVNLFFFVSRIKLEACFVLLDCKHVFLAFKRFWASTQLNLFCILNNSSVTEWEWKNVRFYMKSIYETRDHVCQCWKSKSLPSSCHEPAQEILKNGKPWYLYFFDVSVLKHIDILCLLGESILPVTIGQKASLCRFDTFIFAIVWCYLNVTALSSMS